jgi:tRNA(Ile)-lysidine synthase
MGGAVLPPAKDCRPIIHPIFMASSLVSRIAETIREIVRPGERVVVGLSGGLDSVALLDVLARLSRRRRFRLSALHVNHQLSPNAPRWAAFCRELCRTQGIALRTVKVRVRRGDSVEAAARTARYDVFGRLRADHVALGHNQDDQAETLLLQLLRGAGVKGLAAMPLARIENRGSRIEGKGRILNPGILRPLLHTPRAEIERYARRRGLEWVEDESNADTYFLRNFVRREVLPVIAGRWPMYRKTLGRAARNFAEAAQLLDELALADGAGFSRGGALEVAGLRRLSRARAGNLLRGFLGAHGVLMPNAGRLKEALRQALTAKDDARICIDLGDHELRRFAGALHVVRKLPAPPAGLTRVWRGERRLALPELGGVLTMLKSRVGGIDPARLKAGKMAVRLRRGGERLQPDCARPRRSLKNLLQEAGVPPWRRSRLPLLFCDGTLVWAPEIGVDCSFQARSGAPGLLPRWREFGSRS